jgi:DNA-binding MarR family transcriptional regulator
MYVALTKENMIHERHTVAKNREIERDFVDKMVEEIHVENPDLDTRAFGVLSRIVRAASFVQAATDRMAARAGVTYRELLVLAALRRAGPAYSLSPGQLLKECFAPSATMTRQVDRLHAKGLVEREPDPDDRRAVIVRLTPRGKKLIDSTLTLGKLGDEPEWQVAFDLSFSEIESLNRNLRKLLIMLESQKHELTLGAFLVRTRASLAAK